jgi:zona occludens toxin (predicted ATPase)
MLRFYTFRYKRNKMLLLLMMLMLLVSAVLYASFGSRSSTIIEPPGEEILCTTNAQCAEMKCEKVNKWYCEPEAFPVCLQGVCVCGATCL